MTTESSYGWRRKRPASTATSEKPPPLSARPNSDLIEKRDEIRKLLREYERLKGLRLDYDDLLLFALKKLKAQKTGQYLPRTSWSMRPKTSIRSR